MFGKVNQRHHQNQNPEKKTIFPHRVPGRLLSEVEILDLMRIQYFYSTVDNRLHPLEKDQSIHLHSNLEIWD